MLSNVTNLLGQATDAVPGINTDILPDQATLGGARDLIPTVPDIGSLQPPDVPEIDSFVPSLPDAAAAAESLRVSTASSEIVAERMSAALMAPPQLSPQDQERFAQGVQQDQSAHQVMATPASNRSTTIKSGSLVFTWCETNQKKVPYWIIPDGLVSDPFFVEKVLDAVQLPYPNLILRFSRLKQPVHEWRSGWNFDFTNDGYVEESALPRALPPGMSRATPAVQKYLASVAKDRVLDILKSVSSACNQAGAWLQISDFEPGEEPLGFYDHVAPLVGQAAQKESVIFTTYCMEDRKKYPGGEGFCSALSQNAGVEGHEFPQMRPTPFTEDVTSEMETMGLIEKNEEVPQQQSSKGRSGRGSLFDVEVEHFFKDRLYLPSKDLTHLLVFESKSSEMQFKQLLNARTPIGNFIMQGSVAAMNMFASSIKDGTPVFVLNGTGGAADRIALLIQHMKWRKRITELGGDKPKKEADGEKKNESAGCFPWGGRQRAKVEAGPPREDAVAGAKDIEDEDLEVITVRQLVAALQSKAELLQRDFARAEAEGDLVRGMALKTFLHEMQKCLEQGKLIEGKMLEFLRQEAAEMAEQQALDEEFERLRERVMEGIRTHGRTRQVEAKRGKGGPKSDYEKARERTRNLTIVMPRSRDPPEFYQQQVRRGNAGLAWERKVGMPYEQWLVLPEDQKGEERLPPEWPLLWIGHAECAAGSDDGVPAACRQEACGKCFGAQAERRRVLREVARWDKDWLELDAKVRQDYVRQWVANNPLADDSSIIALCGSDKVAELSRVIFSNVYEPPVPDAVVVVQTLDVDLSVEEVMDKVTLAMSTDGLVSEVGERRAFRERMLEAWKMARMLKYNAMVQNRIVHVLSLLIILFTFAAVFVGTVTYQVSTILDKAEAADEEPSYPGFEDLDFEQTYDILVPINVALPLAASFLLALNSKFSPQNKYNALVTAMYTIESEIFKYRAKVGEYSAQGGLLQPSSDSGDGKGDRGGSKEAPKKKNARSVFAARMDNAWSELGSSELKQDSLLQPKHLDHTMLLDRIVSVQQHPSLFEEGKVLQSGDRKLVRDTIERYTREVDDDGLRTISAQDYLDLRVAEFHRKYQRRAPRFSRLLNLLQLLIFTATTLSTALGAFGYSQWIPVAMAFGAAVGSIVAYTQLEARLQRVNTALVAMNKLHIWWQRLSVIEQRIPHNKTFLVETAEAIIQTEAGCNLVNAQIDDEEDSGEGNQDESKGNK